MRGLHLLVVGSCALASAGSANGTPPSPPVAENPVVLVNATTTARALAGMTRIGRVLESRGIRARLPQKLTATLDGRDVLVADLDAIVEQVANLEYDRALEIIRANEEQLLQGAGRGDPIPALSQLFEWRGVIAAAREDTEEAIRQFRAAHRLNPSWVLDPRLSTSAVRRLVKKAKKEPSELGRLRVITQPEDAVVTINGVKPQDGGKDMVLPVGLHLVIVTAKRRSAYANMVDIQADQVEEVSVDLAAETETEKAAKIVDSIVAAPPGRDRLAKLKSLRRITKSSRFLVIEDTSTQGLTARLYDVGSISVSNPIELGGAETSAEIASRVLAALEPTRLVKTGDAPTQMPHWYQRWYVWAGLGALAGAAAVGYHYAVRAPTTIRGF